MTGLDPTRHVIVEIATLITDDDLNIVAEGPDLVVHATDEQLAEMDDVVVEMHTASGLLEQIRSSTLTLEEAGADAEFLVAHPRAAHRAALRQLDRHDRGSCGAPAADRGSSTTGRSTSTIRA